MAHISTAEKSADSEKLHHGFWALTVGAIGVVFGDIGTSPLYAMREALHHTAAGTDPKLAAFGVISLIFWSLLLLVTVKYTIFLMRADNRGEGGVLALMALAQSALSKPSKILLILGMCGAALFYGDSFITPALSVLSAIEGLKDAPNVGSRLEPYVLPLTFVILIGLFLVQSKGTEKVARLFGPIMLVWYGAMGLMGLYYVLKAPMVLMALSPHYGIAFLMANGFVGFVILGSVFLAVTGAEALYADMGHFGRKPINTGWLWVAFPGLMINYLGQAALTILEPSAAENPFWRMVPELFYWPVLILAAMATIIASQAVISGAFSLSQQAVQLGILPRMDIRRTSETQEGQIYVPQINIILMVGVLFLVAVYKSSSNLTAAYGVAVTATMMISTIMAYIVIRRIWLWSRFRTLLLLLPLGTLEAVFLASNLTKFFSGAWMTLVLGGAIMMVMLTWDRGARFLSEKAKRDSLPLNDLIDMMQKRPPHRVSGTAIFLSSDPSVAPTALMHNLKHNKMLHEQNIIVTVKTCNTPMVAEEERVKIDILRPDFKILTLNFGFMESPNVPRALGKCRKMGLKFEAQNTTFFLGRRTVVPASKGDMPLWQDYLFIFMMKNAANPTDYFHIPAGRVVELGTQVSL